MRVSQLNYILHITYPSHKEVAPNKKNIPDVMITNYKRNEKFCDKAN